MKLQLKQQVQTSNPGVFQNFTSFTGSVRSPCMLNNFSSFLALYSFSHALFMALGLLNCKTETSQSHLREPNPVSAPAGRYLEVSLLVGWFVWFGCFPEKPGDSHQQIHKRNRTKQLGICNPLKLMCIGSICQNPITTIMYIMRLKKTRPLSIADTVAVYAMLLFQSYAKRNILLASYHSLPCFSQYLACYLGKTAQLSTSWSFFAEDGQKGRAVSTQ